MSPLASHSQQEGIRQDLRGSAVCTASKSVLAYEDETFTLSPLDRNDCPLDAKQGYADMAGVLLLFLLLLLLGKAQEKAAEFAETQVGFVGGGGATAGQPWVNGAGERVTTSREDGLGLCVLVKCAGVVDLLRLSVGVHSVTHGKCAVARHVLVLAVLSFNATVAV